MKLPSLISLWQGTLAVIKRFPLQFVIVIIAITTSLWMVEVEHKNIELFSKLAKLLAICNITFTLLLAADLYAEMEQLSSFTKNTVRLGVLIIGLLLFFTLEPAIYQTHLYQLILAAIVGHLLVAFFPFIRKNAINGFWQFNKTLFLRFITAVLYSVVLFVGLAIALFAVNNLFSLHLDDKYYFRLFLVISICFNTVFFLAGIPAEISTLEKQNDYPKGLKIFTQYVLIPLMSIYLMILLVYEIKIIMDWQLPKGLVSNLIIGYAFFGILALLLINPIRNIEGNTWIRLFSRFFYLMMIPLLILLLLAIYVRVGNYGITEPRYFLIAIALWLIFITSYFLWSKEQNIKIIPLSLCIVVIGCSFGPQGAFYRSRVSQITRLEKINLQHPNDKDYEKASIIRYLIKNHGLSSLQHFTKKDLIATEVSMNTSQDSISYYQLEENKIDTAYALLRINRNKIYPSNNLNYNVSVQNDQVVNVINWDYMIRLDDYQQLKQAKMGEDSIFIQRSNDSRTCTVQIDNYKHTFKLDSLFNTIQKAFDTKTLTPANEFNNTFYLSQEKMQLSAIIDDYQAQLSFLTISVNNYQKEHAKKDTLFNFRAYLLLKKVK
ncbi:MAG TPA: DUF4153 domain-containing protein [Pseudosphingobacterium sp.]|nr:DUF4153 domain-containing protein [Pseudosphingobacterium sp.]